MEAAAAEGAVGLSNEARDGSSLSGASASASEDADTVVGVSYGMDCGEIGTRCVAVAVLCFNKSSCSCS